MPMIAVFVDRKKTHHHAQLGDSDRVNHCEPFNTSGVFGIYLVWEWECLLLSSSPFYTVSLPWVALRALVSYEMA